MISAVVLRAQSDERLVALAAAGSEPAFEAIVARYRRDLLAFCSRIQRSDVRGEDTVQQALLCAWTSLRRGTEVRELKPWLYRITYNQAISALRRGRDDVVELPEALTSGESAFEVQERRTLMRDTLSAVAALPDSQRRALLGTAVAGDSYEQVASAMGMSDTAIRGLVHRARVSVRAAVAVLSPAPLVALAARGARRPTGGVAWVMEALGLGGASAGASGVVSGPVSGAGVASGVAVKAAAVIASTAALAGGALVTTHPRASSGHHVARAGRSSRSVVSARSAGATRTAAAPASHAGDASAQPAALVLRHGTATRPPSTAARIEGFGGSTSRRRPRRSSPPRATKIARSPRGVVRAVRSEAPGDEERTTHRGDGGGCAICATSAGPADAGTAGATVSVPATSGSDPATGAGATSPSGGSTSTSPALTEATIDPAPSDGGTAVAGGSPPTSGAASS